jgi:hypothetical protein
MKATSQDASFQFNAVFNVKIFVQVNSSLRVSFQHSKCVLIPLMRATCSDHRIFHSIVSTNYDALFFIALSLPENSLSAPFFFQQAFIVED